MCYTDTLSPDWHFRGELGDSEGDWCVENNRPPCLIFFSFQRDDVRGSRRSVDGLSDCGCDGGCAPTARIREDESSHANASGSTHRFISRVRPLGCGSRLPHVGNKLDRLTAQSLGYCPTKHTTIMFFQLKLNVLLKCK